MIYLVIVCNYFDKILVDLVILKTSKGEDFAPPPPPTPQKSYAKKPWGYIWSYLIDIILNPVSTTTTVMWTLVVKPADCKISSVMKSHVQRSQEIIGKFFSGLPVQ